MPQPVEVTRLTQAIEQFKARAPRDLPDGVLEKINDLSASLSEAAPAGGESPGARAAAESGGGGTEGTGENYRRAARGKDKPSPGQREVQKASVSDAIASAATKITGKMKGDGGEGTSQTR